jgi:hypothetical protein
MIHIAFKLWQFLRVETFIFLFSFGKYILQT